MPDEGASQDAAVDALRALVARLPESSAPDARTVETHISLLLLSGEHAWKFKKPVCFPFADFSDASTRARLCHVEVELNRRLAPDLYLGVSRVTGSPRRPRLDGRGQTIEHAVRMRRFDCADEALHALSAGRLTSAHLCRLGGEIAAAHAAAEVAPAEHPFARAADLRAAWREDVLSLEPLARGGRAARIVALDDAWSKALRRAQPLLRTRRRAGRVRACHGDLHLANLVLLDDHLTAFDCIEFNDEFRFIDTCNETAFLFMDLERMHQPLLARAFLDGYLQASGDYRGLALLGLFGGYRASVRAKIAALRLAQQRGAAERRASLREVDAFLAVGARLLAPRRAGRLLLTRGLSGSGKSRLAAALARHAGCLRLRSDVERRRLFDVETDAGRCAAYAAGGVRRTYRLLREQACCALLAGFDVIVDATFLAAVERRRFLETAARLGAPARILDVVAPLALLEQRVARRAARADDVSQADVSVLHRQYAAQQALDEHERCISVGVRTDRDVDVAALWRRLRWRAAERTGVL